jgi:hypothetical protein
MQAILTKFMCATTHTHTHTHEPTLSLHTCIRIHIHTYQLEAARQKKDEGNNAVKKKDFTNAARLYTSALKVLPENDKEESYLM